MCQRFTHVRFREYEAMTPIGTKVHVFTVTASDLSKSLKAQDNLEQYHTILHCPKRQLTAEQIEQWEKDRLNPLSFVQTVPDPLGAFVRKDLSDHYFSVVPCAACDPARYGKAVHVECCE